MDSHDGKRDMFKSSVECTVAVLINMHLQFCLQTLSYNLTVLKLAQVSHTVSYPFGYGKAITLKVLKSADHSAFGEEGATLEQLMETGRTYTCSLYGVAAGKSVVSALYTNTTRGKVFVS